MRRETIIDNGWFFKKEDVKEAPDFAGDDWEKISLPHSWNAFDGQDGGADYYRGCGCYLKEFYIPEIRSGRQYYLEFGAASYDCTVYVNGTQVCRHKGGYSAFRANVTNQLVQGRNIIFVRLTNETKGDIYPQMADFTFYGGLHRSVRFIDVDDTHFELDFWGASGLAVSSETDDKGSALLKLGAYVTNPDEGDQIRYTLTDGEGRTVTEIYRCASEPFINVNLDKIRLWQGISCPYLYTVKAEIIRHNEVLDCVEARHGFRNFYVDPQKGFFLNGVLTPLRGVSRHQDKLGIGNALQCADHILDAELIKEVGANTVRLAHYQHSQQFYELCDEYGFIVWAEIPFISKMNTDPEAHRNCITQLKELIYQNFNHPSVCFWGISNEITIGGTVPGLVENLKDLNRIVHEIDSTRLSTMAQVSVLDMDDEQNRITDVVSYNHYFGWYGGDFSDNEKWIDKFHEKHPDRPLGISEYGCEGIISYHSDSPKAGDYSEEYQALYHEHMLKVLEARPWIWGSHVWNMFDFGCDMRDEGGVAGRNNKGLVSFDRRIKKDSFYLYKAYWTDTPMVHICGKRYAKRSGEEISVKVYTNCPSVTVYINGVEIAEKKGSRVLVFDKLPFGEGFITVTACAEGACDSAVFENVGKLPSSYTFKQDMSEVGVTNWFEDKSIGKQREMTFKNGYYSVKHSVREILGSEEAGRILLDALSSMMGMNLKKSMLMIMGEQTPENMFENPKAAEKFGGDVGAVLSLLNEELQKIKIDDKSGTEA